MISSDPAREEEVDPKQHMMVMIGAYRISAFIGAASKLGIPDFLAENPKTTEELARLTGTHAHSLHRMLRFLACFGVFTLKDGFWTLTPLARMLCSDIEGSLGPMAIMAAEPWHWSVWGNVAHTIKTGEPAFRHLHGTGTFEFFDNNPEAAQIFQRTMASFGVEDVSLVREAFEFGGVRTVVDVGGGNGTFICAFLHRYPGLSAILLDLPHVICGAKNVVRRERLEERCTLFAGDFFRSIPTGDVLIIKNVIHDWSDQEAGLILHNCREALAPDGRLLLVEYLVSEDNEPDPAIIMDGIMLVMESGRERTEEEFRKLLRQERFEVVKITPSHGRSVIEAKPM